MAKDINIKPTQNSIENLSIFSKGKDGFTSLFEISDDVYLLVLYEWNGNLIKTKII